MKKIVLSVCTVAAMSSLVFAGGGMKEVAPAVEPVIVVPAVDEGGFYLGLALAYNQTYSTDYGFWDDDVLTQDETLKLVGQVGYNFNEYIAIEGRIGGSIAEENYADVMTYSLFVKPQYPISEDFTIYGLLGFGLVQIDGHAGDNNSAWPNMIGQEILSETVFQWGGGIDYKINENFSVFADFTILANDADISSTLYSYDPLVYDELSTHDLTVGVNYRF